MTKNREIFKSGKNVWNYVPENPDEANVAVDGAVEDLVAVLAAVVVEEVEARRFRVDVHLSNHLRTHDHPQSPVVAGQDRRQTTRLSTTVSKTVNDISWETIRLLIEGPPINS